MKPNVPSTSPLDEAGDFTKAWTVWHERVSTAIERLTRVGTTAQRPTSGDGLDIGDPYYDTTLGYEIRCAQVKPAIVWHNGAGAVV